MATTTAQTAEQRMVESAINVAGSALRGYASADPVPDPAKAKVLELAELLAGLCDADSVEPVPGTPEFLGLVIDGGANAEPDQILWLVTHGPIGKLDLRWREELLQDGFGPPPGAHMSPARFHRSLRALLARLEGLVLELRAADDEQPPDSASAPDLDVGDAGRHSRRILARVRALRADAERLEIAAYVTES